MSCKANAGTPRLRLAPADRIIVTFDQAFVLCSLFSNTLVRPWCSLTSCLGNAAPFPHELIPLLCAHSNFISSSISPPTDTYTWRSSPPRSCIAPWRQWLRPPQKTTFEAQCCGCDAVGCLLCSLRADCQMDRRLVTVYHGVVSAGHLYVGAYSIPVGVCLGSGYGR